MLSSGTLFAQVEYTSGGAANAFTLTYPANITSLTSGLSFTFKANHTITGAATMNINGLGPISIKKEVSQDLATNDIKSGQIVIVVYDGTNFQMITIPGVPGGGPPSGAAGGSLSGTYPNPGIAAGAIGTAEIADGTVTGTDMAISTITYSKFQNVTASQLLGNPTGVAAAPSEIGLGTGLSFSAGNLIISGGVLSGGTTNYIPKWTSATALSSTSLLFDDGTNLGVGDATPLALFTVGAGDLFRINSTGNALGIGGSAASPSYSFTADPNTGFYNSGIDQISISTFGTERFRFASTGQLQSTKAPSAATPDYSFSVNSSTGIYSSGVNNLNFSTAGTEALRITSSQQLQTTKAPSAAMPDYSFSANTSTGMYSSGIGNLNFSTAGTEALRITSSQQLQTTKAPSAAMPDYSFSANTSTGMYSSGIGNLNFSTSGTEALRITSSQQLQTTKAPSAAMPDYSFSANTSTGMYSSGVNTLNFSTNGTERLKISSAGVVTIANLVGPGYVQADGTGILSIAAIPSGASAWTRSAPYLYLTNSLDSVGIGTSSPTAKLHIVKSSIAGTGDALYSTTDGSGTSVKGLNTGTGIAGYFQINNVASSGEALSVSTNGGNSKGINVSHTGLNAGSTDYGVYSTSTGAGTNNIGGYFSASGATNNYAGIFENGNVGIGTTAPGNLLHVEQNVAAQKVNVYSKLVTSSGAGINAGVQTDVAGSGTGNVYGSYNIASSSGTGAVVSVLGYSTGANSGDKIGGDFGAAGTAGANYAIRGFATGVTAGTNTGGYFSASGATNNYAIIVPSGGGNVGIGTTSPGAKLDVQDAVASGAAVAGKSTGGGGTGVYGNATNAGYAVTGYASDANSYSGYFSGGKGLYSFDNISVGNSNPTTSLTTSGGVSFSIVTISANVTLSRSHYTVIIPNGSGFTVTLPAASAGNVGWIYVIVNRHTAAKTIGTYQTIAAGTSTTVGASTSITVQSDGVNWYRIH